MRRDDTGHKTRLFPGSDVAVEQFGAPRGTAATPTLVEADAPQTPMSNMASADLRSTRSANPRPERARTLVFADDRSPRADVAWLWICSQRWDGWNLEVITADPTQWGRPTDETVLHPWQPECPRALFAESRLGRVAHLTAAADPRLLLLRAGGLTVLGEHGPGLLKTFHLASTVEWLLRKRPDAR